MSFLTKEDKTVIQSMQTSEKDFKAMEKAKKNKGKRSMGRPLSEEEMAKLKPIAMEYDVKVLEQNLKENNKILKESGREEIKWEEIYGEINTEKPTDPLAFEHYIEVYVTDDECRVVVSDNNFNRGQEWATKLGKPTVKLKTGELFWKLPSNYFVFGGKRYSVAKSGSQASHNEVHLLWSSQNPSKVFYETADTRWIAHAARLHDKKECKYLGGKKKNGNITYLKADCSVNLMKIPNRKG